MAGAEYKLKRVFSYNSKIVQLKKGVKRNFRCDGPLLTLGFPLSVSGEREDAEHRLSGAQ